MHSKYISKVENKKWRRIARIGSYNKECLAKGGLHNEHRIAKGMPNHEIYPFKSIETNPIGMS